VLWLACPPVRSHKDGKDCTQCLKIVVTGGNDVSKILRDVQAIVESMTRKNFRAKKSAPLALLEKF